jgi:hypothetical protein
MSPSPHQNAELDHGIKTADRSFGNVAQFRYLEITIINYYLIQEEIRPPLWSSGLSSWLQIRRPGFDSRHYQEKKGSGFGTGSTQPRDYN